MANTFNFIGKIVPIKDTEKFKGYTETVFDSGWMIQRLRFNLVAGDNRHLIEISAGRWKDDNKNSEVYTFDNDGNKIQIPWANRMDDETIKKVAGYRLYIIDTDTFAHRNELRNDGKTDELEASNKKRRHYIVSSDFLDFAKKVVYSEKAKNMLFRVKGNVNYTYNEKADKYYETYEANKIERVDDDKAPQSNVTVDFYYKPGFIEKDLSDNNKAILSGFSKFYDNATKGNYFSPTTIIMRENETKIDAFIDSLNDFDEDTVQHILLSCEAIDGAQKRDIKPEEINDRAKKLIAAGLMTEEQAIRNAGGQTYGDNIRELRYKDISRENEPTEYTVEFLNKKPQVDIFSDGI